MDGGRELLPWTVSSPEAFVALLGGEFKCGGERNGRWHVQGRRVYVRPTRGVVDVGWVLNR